MKLIYLKEGRNYTSEDLIGCIKDQIKPEKNDAQNHPDDYDWLTSAFLERLRRSINSEFKKTVVKGKEGKFVFHYLGLYDFVDTETENDKATGKNLTFFFVPKFIDFQEGSDCNYDNGIDDEEDKSEIISSDSWRDRIQKFSEKDRNAVLLAIDRYSKEQNQLATQVDIAERKRESILELAVRVLRDYLENGLYVVQRHELEHNGQGEIDWNSTIDQFQPVIVRERPYYMDVMTEQAYSDEDHYITRLHKCLVTVWGRKLEELGLSSVLRVNVPLLSEEELDHLGDADYQVAQINKELNVQFVTKSRETLRLMKELVQRSSENQTNNYESLSFGMTGVEHLWETACAEVLGTELEEKIRDCGFEDGPEDVTFNKYMPRVFWQNLVPDENGKNDAKALNSDKGSQRSKKAGWRLDFIRTWRPNGRVEKLVILDAKYYCAKWRNGTINGQPGTPDIAKQMFYQMAFLNLVQDKNIGMVNAFLLPEDDENPKYNLGDRVKKTETVRLESREKGRDKFEETLAFKDIKLFTVRIPGIRLLERYANWEIADDWFESIVNAAPKGEDGEASGPNAPDGPDAPEKKGGKTDEPAHEPTVEGNAQIEVSTTGLGKEKSQNAAVPSGDPSIVIPKNNGEPVSPIVDDGLSKEFIRDVMSIPSCSGREEMMKEYIKQFATARRIEVKEDAKGNLYLTKGKTTNEKGYYPCLVNHMDTEQEKHLPYIKDHKRLKILERKNGDGQTEFYVQGMGIGADDKSGCAIALALLDKLPIAKAAFFVEEERGMVGSKELDREWFNDVGFCLSFDSPERNRSARTCENARTHQKEKLYVYEDWFFQEILKPICDVHGITVFKDEPPTDIVQIRQKTPIMCYNVGNGGSYPPHALNEFLVVEDAQAAYKFGFDLLSKIGENRYWFGDDDADTSGGDGDGTPRDSDPPETSDSVNPAATDGSDSISSPTSDVCNCKMESAATKSGLAQLDSPCKIKGLDREIADDVSEDTTRPQTKEQQVMPGLKIYHGSRIEDLAEKLVEELKTERKDPFEFLKVAVANPNLGNWLKMKVLAKVPELSAGVEMPFIDDRLAELVKANSSGQLELISGRDYPAFVLDALMNHWRKEFVPFRKYIKEEFDPSCKQTKIDAEEQNGAEPDEVPLKIVSQREARKAVQLSDKLAQLIDSYEATGYLGLLEENKDKNEVYRGEQALVETLFGTGDTKGLLAEKGKISFRQLFDAVKGKKPSGDPKRIVLFGQTSLTDLQIKVLVWLSQTHEINWYCPANIYCANSQSAFSSIEGAAAYNVDVDKTIHKLCQCLKDTFGNAIYPDERICKPNASDSVLSRLQVKFSRVGLLAAAVRAPQDASVQIVGAPGIRREVEMVYNAILGAVWEKNEDGKPVPKKGMSFSDIAVLVPDMPTYRPMIEAVFEGRGQIPYGLVDTTTQDYSTYLDGFLALMDIARYGLSRKRLFAVLENPCVQRAMGFSRDDVINWLELTKDYGAYEGYKEQDSDEKNVSGHFNWEWALRRMRLGLVAKDESIGVTKGGDDKLPLEARDADDVYKFSEVVETLFRKLSALSHMAPALCSSKDEKVWPDTWAGRLHKIMDEFLAVDKDDGIEPLVRARIVRTLNGLTTIAGEQSSYMLPVAMVEHFVAGVESAKGGYLRHGVTIGGLRSLANVPFKQIFVLGLGEGVFPGRNDCSTLDVRNETKAENRSDLLSPQENRARFRAAILSARDRLVLTYCNRELGSDTRLYPSSPVYDVEEVLTNDMTTEKFKEFKWYPLVEYAEALERQDVGKDEVKAIHSAVADEKVDPCFEGLLPTYSKRAYILAGRKPHDGAVPAVAVDADGSKMPDLEKFELGEPTPKDLAEFVKDPFTAVLKRRLGIAVKGYRDRCLTDSSPLGLEKGPIQWELEREIVTLNFETAFAVDMQKAHVPHDFLGKFAKRRISKVVPFWEAADLTRDEREIVENRRPTNVLAVICKSFRDSKDHEHIQLPPSPVLEPLFERLKLAKVRGDTRLDFAVKVLNVEHEIIGYWKWNLDLVNKDADNYAGDYYEAVRSMYLGFLTCAKNHDSCPSFLYDDLREYLISRVAYDRICTYLKESDDSATLKWQHEVEAMLSDEDNKFFKKTKNAFDNNPVVMHVLDAFKREPTGDDLRNMFKVLYRIPMSGSESVNGGVQ